jgi:hypothetical protein
VTKLSVSGSLLTLMAMAVIAMLSATWTIIAIAK